MQRSVEITQCFLVYDVTCNFLITIILCFYYALSLRVISLAELKKEIGFNFIYPVWHL